MGTPFIGPWLLPCWSSASQSPDQHPSRAPSPQPSPPAGVGVGGGDGEEEFDEHAWDAAVDEALQETLLSPAPATPNWSSEQDNAAEADEDNRSTVEEETEADRLRRELADNQIELEFLRVLNCPDLLLDSQRQLDAAKQQLQQLQVELQTARHECHEATSSYTALRAWHKPGGRTGWNLFRRPAWEDDEEDEDDNGRDTSDVTVVARGEVARSRWTAAAHLAAAGAIQQAAVREKEASRMAQRDQAVKQTMLQEIEEDAQQNSMQSAYCQLEDEKASLAREVEFLQGEYNAQSDFLMGLKSDFDRIILEVEELQDDKVRRTEASDRRVGQLEKELDDMAAKYRVALATPLTGPSHCHRPTSPHPHHADLEDWFVSRLAAMEDNSTTFARDAEREIWRLRGAIVGLANYNYTMEDVYANNVWIESSSLAAELGKTRARCTLLEIELAACKEQQGIEEAVPVEHVHQPWPSPAPGPLSAAELGERRARCEMLVPLHLPSQPAWEEVMARRILMDRAADVDEALEEKLLSPPLDEAIHETLLSRTLAPPARHDFGNSVAAGKAGAIEAILAATIARQSRRRRKLTGCAVSWRTARFLRVLNCPDLLLDSQRQLDAAKQQLQQLQEQLKTAERERHEAESAKAALMAWDKPGRQWGCLRPTYWEDEEEEDLDDDPHSETGSDITVIERDALSWMREELDEAVAELQQKDKSLETEFIAHSDELRRLQGVIDRMILEVEELQDDKVRRTKETRDSPERSTPLLPVMREQLAEMETHSAIEKELREDRSCPIANGNCVYRGLAFALMELRETGGYQLAMPADVLSDDGDLAVQYGRLQSLKGDDLCETLRTDKDLDLGAVKMFRLIVGTYMLEHTDLGVAKGQCRTRRERRNQQRQQQQGQGVVRRKASMALNVNIHIVQLDNVSDGHCPVYTYPEGAAMPPGSPTVVLIFRPGHYGTDVPLQVCLHSTAEGAEGNGMVLDKSMQQCRQASPNSPNAPRHWEATMRPHPQQQQQQQQRRQRQKASVDEARGHGPFPPPVILPPPGEQPPRDDGPPASHMSPSLPFAGQPRPSWHPSLRSGGQGRRDELEEGRDRRRPAMVHPDHPITVSAGLTNDRRQPDAIIDQGPRGHRRDEAPPQWPGPGGYGGATDGPVRFGCRGEDRFGPLARGPEAPQSSHAADRGVVHPAFTSRRDAAAPAYHNRHRRPTPPPPHISRWPPPSPPSRHQDGTRSKQVPLTSRETTRWTQRESMTHDDRREFGGFDLTRAHVSETLAEGRETGAAGGAECWLNFRLVLLVAACRDPSRWPRREEG
ncbi:unnamed protein product [Vitrella brassicaformis CCMP3155]|uniref:OTU domain-containing protein n=1 Tax=Vitrella brassicaformis (strain CCMP3155) TaxID=1169540 RepID=A0A0G4EAY5_VITBC|nr:unnamed protein product [Vitrella brassicaformis CCMP3155]|eukprot:CEL92449.1 unnamed protein product [Vitrella brassicaformis CCMP3155]